MKIICDCGAVTEFVDSKDGRYYVVGDGWYKIKKGEMEISEAHDQVFFHCNKCGNKIWIFT